MSLFIGTTLICISTIWATVLLIGGRNPSPPWYAGDWIMADVQVPLMMGVAVFGIWFMARFDYHHMFGAGSIEAFLAASAVAATVLIIRSMKVGRRLREFAEMEADSGEEDANGEPAQLTTLYRKLPWQVRLYLADHLGYDLALIRSLRCVIREMADRPAQTEFLAFNPDQATAQGVLVTGYDTLEGRPELVLCRGTFSQQGSQVTIESAPTPRRAA